MANTPRSLSTKLSAQTLALIAFLITITLSLFTTTTTTTTTNDAASTSVNQKLKNGIPTMYTNSYILFGTCNITISNQYFTGDLTSYVASASSRSPAHLIRYRNSSSHHDPHEIFDSDDIDTFTTPRRRRRRRLLAVTEFADGVQSSLGSESMSRVRNR